MPSAELEIQMLLTQRFKYKVPAGVTFLGQQIYNTGGLKRDVTFVPYSQFAQLQCNAMATFNSLIINKWIKIGPHPVNWFTSIWVIKVEVDGLISQSPYGTEHLHGGAHFIGQGVAKLAKMWGNGFKNRNKKNDLREGEFDIKPAEDKLSFLLFLARYIPASGSLGSPSRWSGPLISRHAQEPYGELEGLLKWWQLWFTLVLSPVWSVCM